MGACVQTLHTKVPLLFHFHSCDGDTVEPHRPPFFATTSQFNTEGRRRIREWLSVLTATHNCFQPLQGFSNGDFTDVKKLRYVILTDRLVLIQLTGDNRFTNMFRDYIRGRWCTSKWVHFQVKEHFESSAAIFTP